MSSKHNTDEFQYSVNHSNELANADFANPDSLLDVVGGIVGGLVQGILGSLLGVNYEIVGLKDENSPNPSIGADIHRHIVDKDDYEFTTFSELKGTLSNLRYVATKTHIVFLQH